MGNFIDLLGALKQYQIVIIVLCVVIGIALIVIAVMAALHVKSKRAGQNKSNDKIKVVDGVRYTEDDRDAVAGEVNVTHNEGDFVLSRGVTYKAVKDGKLLPGKYKILSADGNVEKFNVRHGGFVREMSHGSDLVLGDGDEITSVSHTAILR